MSKTIQTDVKSKKTLELLVGREVEKVLSKIGTNLEGKLLTLIDASFTDPEQRKAFKDIVKEVLIENYYSKIHIFSNSLRSEIGKVVGDKNIEADDCCIPDISNVWLSSNLLDYIYTRKEK